MYSNERIIVKKNTDQNGNTIVKRINNEVQPIYKNVAVLTQCPSNYHRIIIDNFIERMDLIDSPLAENEFFVDYDSGKLYFNSCMNNKQVTIREYYGIGYEAIPTSRIYTKLNDSGIIVETLDVVINKCLEVIGAISEINKTIENSKVCKSKLESTIGVGNKTISDINSVITNANNKKQELNNTINSANTTNNNSVIKRQELEGTINKANNLKNEIEQKIKDNNVVTNAVFNNGMSKKAEKTETILKVSVPNDRDCNTFKTLNAFCSWDTGNGDFKNTPEGNLSKGTTKVFILTNKGFHESRFQQEFSYIFPNDRVTKWIRNYNGSSWGTWFKTYDEANKPTPQEIGTYPKDVIDSRTKVLDTREKNQNPKWYIDNYPWQTVTEFKYAHIIGVSSKEVFGVLETRIPWNNTSGGYPTQTFTSNSTETYQRHGNSETEWSKWERIYTTGSKPTADELNAWSKVATRLEGADFNTITEGGIYATVRNTIEKHAPTVSDGRLLVMSWNFGKWASQMFFADGGRIFTRTATDIEGKGWTPWDEIYSKRFKQSLEEIGALSKSGGKVNGTLKFESTGNEIEIVNPSKGLQARGMVFKDNYDSNNITGMFGAYMNGHEMLKTFMGITATPWDGIKSFSVDKQGCYYDNQKIYHKGNKPTPQEIGASDTSLLLNNRQFFVVNGEVNKYYPVVIRCGSDSGTYGAVKVSISRGYSSQAPDSWNTPTHKGGLTLTVLMTGDYYWGGNDQSIQVLRFEESYSKMVAGMQMATDGLVVWLRGGGAKYCLTSEYGQSASASVKLEKYVDIAKQEFDIRNDTSKVTDEILSLYSFRSSGLYDKNKRVYSPNNKPSLNDIGAINKNGDTVNGNLEMGVAKVFVGSHNYGYCCKTREGSRDYVLYIDTDNKVHIGYNGRPVKIDSLDIVNKNNKRIYHEDNKPTANEIGAFPSVKSNVTDFNKALAEGQYLIAGTIPNAPVSGDRYGILLVYVSYGTSHNNCDNWIWQEYYDTNGNRFWRYKVNNSSWTSWTRKIDGSGFSNSFNDNGYQKLPSGLIVQWGIVSKHLKGGENGMHFVDVNYPIRFPNKALCITGTTMANKYDVGKVKWLCQTDEYNYQHPQFATFRVGVDTGGGATSIYINWMAIGY